MTTDAERRQERRDMWDRWVDEQVAKNTKKTGRSS